MRGGNRPTVEQSGRPTTPRSNFGNGATSRWTSEEGCARRFARFAPHRGATNASYLVPVTIRAMAGVLNIDVPALCRAVSENSERVYGPWGSTQPTHPA